MKEEEEEEEEEVEKVKPYVFQQYNHPLIPYSRFFWRDKMSRKVFLANNHNFGISALAAHIITPCIHLLHQYLANNRPFTKFTNFKTLQYFHYTLSSASKTTSRSGIVMYKSHLPQLLM